MDGTNALTLVTRSRISAGIQDGMTAFSSIRIYGPARVTLYRDINFRGDRVTIDRTFPICADCE